MTDQSVSIPEPTVPAAVPDIPHKRIERFQWRVPLWLIMLGLLIVMAIVFWGTLGFRTNGLVEEWQFYSTFDREGLSLHTILVQLQPDRPFLILPNAIAYALTPNSFVGLQILGMLIFIFSGLALFGIVRQLLPKHPAVAVMAGALLVIYPADTGLFNSRYYSYTFAVLTYLTAVYFLLRYWQHPRWWWLAGLGAMLVVCLGTYETAYPLVLMTPLLLVWQNKAVSRRILRVAGLWYATPIAMLIFAIVSVSATANSYQNTLLDANTAPFPVRYLNYIGYELHAYGRVFVEGWADIFRLLSLRTIGYFTASSLLIGLFVIVSMLIVRTALSQTPPAQPTPALPPSTRWSMLRRAIAARRNSFILFAVGFVAIGLGFLAYLPLPFHHAFTDRVYLFSDFGGAICLSLILYGLANLTRKYVRIVLPILFAAVFSLAGLAAMNRVVGVRYAAGQEQLMLSRIVQQMPQVPDGTAIVIFDRTLSLTTNLEQFGLSWDSHYLAEAVRYLYHQPELFLQVCYPERRVWGGVNEQCTLETDGVHFGTTQTFPYSRVVAFDYQPDSGLALLPALPALYRTPDKAAAMTSYNPASIINAQAQPPARVYTLLYNWPYIPFMPQSLLPQRTLAFDPAAISATGLGEVFQSPLYSVGWGSLGWTAANTASLHVLLAQGTDYHVTFHVLNSALMTTLDHLTLKLNGQTLALTKVTDGFVGATFAGTIPRTAIDLSPTDTLIAFQTDQVMMPQPLARNGDMLLQSVYIDWLRIDPLEAINQQRSIDLNFDNLDLSTGEKQLSSPVLAEGWNGGWTVSSTAILRTRLVLTNGAS